jgi:hypothetical protein
MNVPKHFRAYLTVCILTAAMQPLQVFAQQNSNAPSTSSRQAPSKRDGQHDFEFEIGT